MDSLIYIPGDEPKNSTPLARYLPPLPEGVVATFLGRQFGENGAEYSPWILDPFGASASLAAEIASSGYRTLVAVNNPITRFVLEMRATPPSVTDLRAALAELALARKGGERLETHLQSLYLTTCTKCQQQVPADAFIWERDSGAMVARIYHCPACGDNGEYPALEADRARAASMATTDGLHRARALERVVAPDDPDRVHAEEALECYLPRAVYALITIINKIDGLSLSPERRRALFALVLTACDEGCALWAYPAERPRPKQLTLPSRFLEKNIWQALEQGVELWSGFEKTFRISIWPGLPDEAGGLCLFEGPMRELASKIKDLSIAAVVTALPRPNQAFWTLSALWAGWLWGQNAAASFKPVLRRRRYDWNWHAEALHSTLKIIVNQIPLNTPLFALIAELEPAFLSTALLAAAEAGFDLSGLALRTRQDPAQVLWHRRALAYEEKKPPEIDKEGLSQAMLSTLQKRSEPAPYIFLHAAGLVAMATDHSLRWRPEALAQIHSPLLETLAGPEFIHIAEGQNPESGLWATGEWNGQIEPLPDRVEIATVQFLLKNPACTFRELEYALNTALPGLLTPSLGLIRAVLDSYAQETDGRWILRMEDSPAARHANLKEADQWLDTLGSRLGYSLHREEKNQRLIRWLENGQVIYSFFILTSAVVGRLLRQNPATAGNNFMIIPGGRAGLLAYKLERDVTLRSLAGQWHILKFRHLRRLAIMTGLTREQLVKEFSVDPIEPPEQMKLF